MALPPLAAGCGSGDPILFPEDDEPFRYLTDDDARRTGVEGALGVFGAVQTAEVP